MLMKPSELRRCHLSNCVVTVLGVGAVDIDLGPISEPIVVRVSGSALPLPNMGGLFFITLWGGGSKSRNEKNLVKLSEN